MAKFLYLFFLLTLTANAGVLPIDIVTDKNPPTIRVRVGEGLKNIIVTGTDLKRIIHLKKNKKTYGGRKSIRFDCSKIHRFKVDRPMLLASLTSPTGLLTLDDYKYKGALHIVTSSSQTKCDVINEIDMEYYISSLLSKEMHSSWPSEALKAQAIAARTYAFYKISSKGSLRQSVYEMPFHLENSERHQVSGHFFDATESTHKASFETKGYVLLTEKGLLSPVFFHSKCGGKTLRPDHVWDNVVGGYQSVPCPFCQNYGSRDWEYVISKKDFIKFLNWLRKRKYLSSPRAFTLGNNLTMLPDTSLKTVIRLYFKDRPFVLKKAFFRRYFGRKTIHSNNFRIFLSQESVKLKGSGKGHGVGMCQYGAFDLAKRGWSHQKILAYYFPKYQITKIY